MERSEPALVPGWLKGTSGGATGSNLSHFAASLQSDDPSVVLPARSRSSISSNDHDTSRSTSSDRTSSAYFRRSSSSNGHVMHDRDFRSYSSFGRNLRDRDREKDLDYRFGDHDYPDSLIVGRIEKDSLRRSKSMISTKRVELFPRRVGNGANNDLLVGRGITSNINKVAFQRDFPSLGAEEKRVPEVGRISPPILSTATQSLPMGSSSLMGSDVWTSALVEIPVPVANNNIPIPSTQQVNPVNASSVTLSTTTGLNMAETLAQVPSRARNVPQLSAETQRLEELAIKQSRQLIPVTPSMPKTSIDFGMEDRNRIYKWTKESFLTTSFHYMSSLELFCEAFWDRTRNLECLPIETCALGNDPLLQVQKELFRCVHDMLGTVFQALSSSEKPKAKSSRSGDLSTTAKVGAQAQLGNHVLWATTRSDLSKTTQIGKLQVLKATREKNGMSPAAKESTSPTNASKPLPSISPSAPSATSRNPINLKLAADQKTSASPVIQSTTVDRRLPSQARHDFFNSLRKKTSANHLAAAPDASLMGATMSDKSDEQAGTCNASLIEEKDTPPVASDLSCSTENSSRTVAEVDASKEGSPFGGKNSDLTDGLDEEVKFMRSLGWEENSGEEGGLTEEEINSFFQEGHHGRWLLYVGACTDMQSIISFWFLAKGHLGCQSSALTILDDHFSLNVGIMECCCRAWLPAGSPFFMEQHDSLLEKRSCGYVDQLCIKKCPTSKLCQVMQQSKMVQIGFEKGKFGSASSELNSSNS
ncbi:hypothetical protein ACLOJK_013837 [Asimina triloba]